MNAVGAHHDEIEMTYVISPIVQACVPSAVPSRCPKEILESYLKRIKEMENRPWPMTEWRKPFAIQAGRELRKVIVEAEKSG